MTKIFSQCIASSAVKLGSYDEKEIYQIYKDQIEFDKIFDEKNICHVIQFTSSNSYSLFPYRQPVVLLG